MKKKIVMAGVALGVNEKGRLKEIAQSRDITLSALFKEALAFYLDFEPLFLDTVQRMSKTLQVPTLIIIENLTLAGLARISEQDRPFLVEFPQTPQGYLTGKDFFDYMVKYLKQEKISEQVRRERLIKGMPPVKNHNYPPAQWEEEP